MKFYFIPWLKFFATLFIFKGLSTPFLLLFRLDFGRGVSFFAVAPLLVCLIFCWPVFGEEVGHKAGKKALQPVVAKGSFFREEQSASYSAEEGLSLIVIKATQLRLKVKTRGKKNSGKRASTLPSAPAGSLNLKWKGDASVEQKDGILSLEAKDFSSKKAWKDPLDKEKLLVLEISGGSNTLPLRIFARSIQASVSHWDQAVFVSAFEGSLNALGNRGPWQISLKDGELNIRKHKGQLRLKGSDLKILVSESQGSSTLRLNEGALKFKKWQGDLDFIGNRADLRLQQFKGRLKGKSQSGQLRASIQPENVEWSSRQGDIRLTFIKQAAKVTAYTERGKIYGARHLSREFSGKSTKILGWLKGRPKKGFVSLSSETGNIYLN